MTFANLASKLREIKGDRSYLEMAEQAGISETALWRIMNEQRSPHAGTLSKLLTAFPELREIFLPTGFPNGESE